LDGQLRALRVYCFVYVPFVAAGMRCRREAAWGQRRRRGAIAAATPTVPLPRAGEPVALGVDMVSLPSCLAVVDVNPPLPMALDSVTAVTDGEDRCPRALLQLPAIVCARHDCVTEGVFS